MNSYRDSDSQSLSFMPFTLTFSFFKVNEKFNLMLIILVFSLPGVASLLQGLADIVGGVKNLSGDGTESIEGTDTYRLKGNVPAQALKSLSAEVTATGDLTTTLWIGAGDFLLRKVTLQGPVLSDEPVDIVRTITMKDYNKEVKIETPVVAK